MPIYAVEGSFNIVVLKNIQASSPDEAEEKFLDQMHTRLGADAIYGFDSGQVTLVKEIKFKPPKKG